MRAIANGQVDGFPPKEELRTVYVEHDIDAELSDISVVDYVFADPVLKGEVTLPQVTETLGSVGFTENMQNSPVASLSGGWKMKLALGESSLQQPSTCSSISLYATQAIHTSALSLLMPQCVQLRYICGWMAACFHCLGCLADVLLVFSVLIAVNQMSQRAMKLRFFSACRSPRHAAACRDHAPG